jgi:hypothetical protein
MKQLTKKRASRHIIFTSLSLLAMVIGLVGVAPASKAAAVTCRNIVNPAEAVRYDEGGDYLVGASQPYFVPPSSQSGCLHINVKNITNHADVTDPHCNYFRVRFYPSAGGTYTNDWQWRCSTPPNGTNVAVATDVLSNTMYRVEYQTRWNWPPLSYTIRD